MSPEAQQVLDDFRYFRLPGFIHIKDKQIKKARSGDAAQRDTAQKYADRYGIAITKDTLAGVPVYYLTPNGNYNKEAVGFYIHGGGYVLGPAVDYAIVELAHQLNTRVIAIEYSLAPEVKFPVAVNECFAVYKEVVRIHAGKKIYVTGVSAGGNLAITTILQARDNKIKLPVAAALFTPVTDMTGNGDTYVSNDGRDLLAWRGFIERIGTDHIYVPAGIYPTTPMLSPIYADYDKGFVPTVLVTGTRDLLLSNTVRFHQKLKTAGTVTELLVYEGMFHGFNAFPQLPEAMQVNKQVAEFLKAQLAIK